MTATLVVPSTDGICLGRLSLGQGSRAIRLTIRADEVEHVGRLTFVDDEGEGDAVVDRGVLPGRCRDEVLERAALLTPDDFARRYARAMTERRRFPRLRDVTHEILGRIRALNGISIAMQAGLVDATAASREVAAIEAQLHALVGRLGDVAGLEERAAGDDDRD